MLLSYLFPSGTSVIDLHSPGRLNQREVLNLSGSSRPGGSPRGPNIRTLIQAGE